mmetsp:Transcript_17003/g.50975  ORF Transcript_17003/g.50975 Transcript_17003/m.50975 type:complete len:155 (+) Transcript_17003:605-1069(+)
MLCAAWADGVPAATANIANMDCVPLFQGVLNPAGPGAPASDLCAAGRALHGPTARNWRPPSPFSLARALKGGLPSCCPHVLPPQYVRARLLSRQPSAEHQARDAPLLAALGGAWCTTQDWADTRQASQDDCSPATTVFNQCMDYPYATKVQRDG